MAGRGGAPKDPSSRVTRHQPERGEIAVATGVGWQHGEQPVAPYGLMPASLEAWSVWMGAWFAAFWSPEDLPGLETVVLLFDQVRRGKFQRAAELRLSMDTYGITPKGQQDRRWRPPVPASTADVNAVAATGTYGSLRSVPDAVEGKRKR